MQHHEESPGSKLSWSASQQEAVEHGEGPLLVLAGPGSGKTRVLIGRIVHLIESGQATPDQILAVTFTRRAADEMRARLAGQLHQAAGQVWIGTLHSFCNRLLRKWPDLVGRTGQFTIYDEKESLDRLGDVKEELLASAQIPSMAELGEDFNLQRATKAAMSLGKNQLYDPQMWLANQIDPEDPYNRAIAATWERYEQMLLAQNAMDFDDLLTGAVELLSHGHVREIERRSWPWVLVDEAQDLSGAQSRLTYLLSGAKGNVTLVGDEDQQIYSWRGADGELMLNFRDYYPEGHTVILEENYRCSAEVLAPAARLIRHNKQRAEKPDQTPTRKGGQVVVKRAADEEHEAMAAVDAIRSFRQGRPDGTVLVLGRSAFAIDMTHRAMITAGILCVRIGGMGSLDRPEIQDGLAFARLIANPVDVSAFERILSQIPGAGPACKATLREISENKYAGDMLAAMLAADSAERSRIRKATAERIIEVARKLDELRQDYLNGRSNQHIIQEALQIPYGPVDRAQQQLIDDDEKVREHAQVVLEELRGLVRAVGQLEESDLSAALGEMRLAGSRQLEPENAATVVSSIHSAKGLEADLVIVVGCDEGILPSRRAMANGDHEEERRGAYVALTRAKDLLMVTWPTERWRFKDAYQTIPSPYLTEGDIHTTRAEGQHEEVEHV